MRIHAGEEVDGVHRSTPCAAARKKQAPDEGCPACRRALSSMPCRTPSFSPNVEPQSTMDLLLALKDGIESDARIEPARKSAAGSITWC
jgi:serine protein kinase